MPAFRAARPNLRIPRQGFQLFSVQQPPAFADLVGVNLVRVVEGEVHGGLGAEDWSHRILAKSEDELAAFVAHDLDALSAAFRVDRDELALALQNVGGENAFPITHTAGFESRSGFDRVCFARLHVATKPALAFTVNNETLEIFFSHDNGDCRVPSFCSFAQLFREFFGYANLHSFSSGR